MMPAPLPPAPSLLGSFTETLAGWAEAVVTGRARLGGIPVGIVATEGRMREKNCPADPADVSSHERIVQQVCSMFVVRSCDGTMLVCATLCGKDKAIVAARAREKENIATTGEKLLL